MAIKVSIVVAAKNARQLLQGLLESVDALPRACREACQLIIVDAASGDGTFAWLAREAAADRIPPVAWLSEPDTGIADAWNKGVGLARGEWLVFLGADDRLAVGTAFGDAIATLDKQSADTMAVSFPIVVFGLPHADSVTCSPVLGRGNAAFFQVNTLPHQGVFHRREAWQRHGLFDTRFTVAADYEFLLRLIKSGESIVVADSAPPVRMAAGGISKQNPLLVLREFRRAQILHGIGGMRWRWWAGWMKALAGRVTAAIFGERVRLHFAHRFRGMTVPVIPHVSIGATRK
jgi:glycosyltransferase involved in cell wall biosynthesis